MTYEGWTNRQTWNVELWLNNDYGLYQARQAMLKDLIREGKEVTSAHAEAWTRKTIPNGTPDMPNAKGYDKVNWQEIADAWNDDIKEIKRYSK